MAFVELAFATTWSRTHGRAKLAGRASTSSHLLALGFTRAPGRALRWLLVLRELTSDDGRSSPVTRPVLGRPAPRRPAQRKRLDRDQERVPCSRFNPSSPATFPCTSRIVCAVCNSCSRRATCASSARTFASSGLRSAGLRADASSRPTPAASPCERVLAPSRQMRAVQPLAAKSGGPPRRSCVQRIRLLQNPQPILWRS